ncbi:MAG: peptide deformylase [bacterium]
MSILNIVKYPDPVLAHVAEPVGKVTNEVRLLINDMIDTMYSADGVGLAAPQVGLSLRIFVVDAGDGPQEFINPHIILQEGEQTGVEGCLSLPGLHGDVTCSSRVVVRATNRRGRIMTYAGEGLWARAIQHENNHLNGKLFVDNVIPGTARWFTGAEDAEGNYIETPTTVEEALRLFRDAGDQVATSCLVRGRS